MKLRNIGGRSRWRRTERAQSVRLYRGGRRDARSFSGSTTGASTPRHDYLGWTGCQDKHDDGVTLATIKFAWADDKPGQVTIKPVSTILVGATPEFEVAALSLAFLCGEQEGDNRMELGRERIKIVCYPHDGKGGPKVASAYIELASWRISRPLRPWI